MALDLGFVREERCAVKKPDGEVCASPRGGRKNFCSGCGTPLATAPTFTALMPGLQIGQYTIESLHGIGSMSLIYRAKLPNQFDIALKETPYEGNPPQIIPLERLKRIQHPNVVGYSDLFEYQCRTSGGVQLFQALAMDMIDGDNLEQRLTRLGNRVEQDTALRWIHNMLSGLAYLQDTVGIIHRDVKPQNLLFDIFDELVLADLGISKLHGTRTHRLVSGKGTPGYAPPEQGSSTDKSSDVYSAVAVALRILLGKPPRTWEERLDDGDLEGEKERQELLAARVPEYIIAALMMGYRIPAAQRQQSIQELIDDLDPIKYIGIVGDGGNITPRATRRVPLAGHQVERVFKPRGGRRNFANDRRQDPFPDSPIPFFIPPQYRPLRDRYWPMFDAIKFPPSSLRGRNIYLAFDDANPEVYLLAQKISLILREAGAGVITRAHDYDGSPMDAWLTTYLEPVRAADHVIALLYGLEDTSVNNDYKLEVGKINEMLQVTNTETMRYFLPLLLNENATRPREWWGQKRIRLSDFAGPLNFRHWLLKKPDYLP